MSSVVAANDAGGCDGIGADENRDLRLEHVGAGIGRPQNDARQGQVPQDDEPAIGPRACAAVEVARESVQGGAEKKTGRKEGERVEPARVAG